MSYSPPHQSADATDASPLVSTSKIDTSDVPEFERPAAAQESLTSGKEPGAIAETNSDKPGQIEVDRPDMYTSAVQSHELTHVLQNSAGADNYVQSDPSKFKTQADVNKVYGYGGTEGLSKIMSSPKGISSLNNEQQASIPQNYMKEYIKAEKAGDAKAIDNLNAAYEPAIRQLRNMANTSKDTINTTPDAPGAPPASATGVAVPVKGMMSNSTRSVALKASDVHNPPPKAVAKSGKSWYSGASALGKGGNK